MINKSGQSYVIAKNEVLPQKAGLFLIKEVGKLSRSDSRHDHACVTYEADILRYFHNI